MKKLMNSVALLLKDEFGQDLIEYALVAGLIGLGAVLAMTTLGVKVSTAFSYVGSELTMTSSVHDSD
ncbi:MAG: Flp family type IVb pilin [Acidobacteriaceae bacterium]